MGSGPETPEFWARTERYLMEVMGGGRLASLVRRRRLRRLAGRGAPRALPRRARWLDHPAAAVAASLVIAMLIGGVGPVRLGGDGPRLRVVTLNRPLETDLRALLANESSLPMDHVTDRVTGRVTYADCGSLDRRIVRAIDPSISAAQQLGWLCDPVLEGSTGILQ